MDRLTHVDESGNAQMVDVSAKAVTAREAVAEGVLKLKDAHAAAIGNLPKGDALAVAQVAGIQAAKRTSDLIPLCHPLPLTSVDVQLEVRASEIRIRAMAKTKAETGVEMEAYTAVAIAGVTLIDMLKGVDPDLELTNIRLLSKTGGKRDWKRE